MSIKSAQPAASLRRYRRIYPLKWLSLGAIFVCLALVFAGCGDATSLATSNSTAVSSPAASTSTTAAAGATTSNGTVTTAVTPDAFSTTPGTSASASSTTQASHTTAVTSTLATTASSSPSSNGTASSDKSTSVGPTGNLETDIRSVVKAVTPSVVLIAVSTQQAQGVGTGSIITQDGFILTNFHVVAAGTASVSSQTQIQVVMTDGKKYPAKVVGTDRANDLAVIKIEATGLPVIKQGSSSALQVGDWVVAVGNALALPGGPTVTSGIVGALGRSIQEPAPASANLTDLIQTNAAINPGNSGGPLLNLKGEIVGINTAAPVDPESGGAAQGIGFAISIDQAKPIIQTLMSGKSIVPAYMGILPVTLTPGLAARYNLSTDKGVLIQTVEPNSPAQSASWKAGDIITEMDGTTITSLDDLQKVLNRHKPGDKVSVTLVTPQGQTEQSSITFGQPPSQ